MKNNFTRLLTITALVLLGTLKTTAQSLVLSVQVNPALCNGACNGTINLTVSGGLPAYTYSWSNGSTTQDFTNVCPGTYTVTVTDATGFTQTASATITQPPPMTLSTCISNQLCFSSCTGKIDLSASGGTPAYTYIWSNGVTTQDISNICAGTYTVTVTDENNCTKTISGSVTQPPPITLAATSTDASNGVNNGAIDLSLSGGTPPFTSTWTGPNGFSSTAQDISNLSPGSYCVTVTDANACTRSSCFAVQGDGGGGPNGPLLMNVQITNSGCGTACTGSLNLSLSNGFEPYYYTIAGPGGSLESGNFFSTQFAFFDLCAGTHCITINDGAGQTVSECYTVGQGQSQNLDIQSTNAAFCNFDPDNASAACEMVCPKTTVTYFVDPPLICGVPMNLAAASWVVSGAESYTANGNEVTVNWGEAGAGLVEFSANTPNLCFESFHCVTILREPTAQFSTEPPSTPNAVMQLCKGQSVTFVNESLDATEYEWQFSDDLSVLSEEHPTHTFRTPGNFAVTLIARSNCLCADTSVLLIEVLDSEPPLLDCVGSVCPGETVTYSTSSNCGAYTWSVSPNGSIVSGGQSGDNTITIQWGEGPVGSISLSASGCAGAACPQASVFSISIISDNAEIRGKAFVCPESEEEYTIELFDGTEYTWTLLSGGSILRGQGTNEITVNWTSPASSTTHWLVVDYFNCYLGCGGVDSIPVKIIAPFFIDGPVEMCENSTRNYTARTSGGSLVQCNWQVFGPNGALLSTFMGSNLNFTPSAGPGNYRLFAVPTTPGQTCSSNAELKVSVAAQPPKPIAIDGPTIVCPGSPLSYEVPGNPPYEISWQTGNGMPAIQTGNPVNVTWNSNPTHWISAAQISLDGLGCKSDTTRLNIQNAANISISGPVSLCAGTVGFYQSDFYEGFDYQWEILPAGVGSVKKGQGKSSVEIFWQIPGTHQIRVTSCGLSVNLSVTIHPNPTPVPNAPSGLCPGESGAVSLSASYAAYAWSTAEGGLLGSGPSVSVESGAYTVQVTDVQGCKGTSEFSIDKLPEPNVSVTTADPAGFCNNSMFVSITALVPDDVNFDYQWLRNGAPVGANSVVHTTNQYGFYTVIVTNEYGCTDSAPPIQLFEYCDPVIVGGGYCPNPGHANPPCDPGVVQAVPDLTSRCDSFTMVLNDYSGMYVPGSAVWWTGISGTPGLEFATGDNVHFVYPNAGKYIISVKVLLTNGQVCESLDSLDVEAAAQFSQQMACPGDPTAFIDESTRLPEVTFATWEWDFGEAGANDTSSLVSPGHAYAAAGNYTATLTVTTVTGCTSSYSENVFVPDLPSPAFAPPLANCAGNATEFVSANNTDIIGMVWDFGDPASGNLNQSEASPAFHNFSPAGDYLVTLSATNNYGCTASFAELVNITANPFSGDIFPQFATICQGSSVQLSAPLGPGAMYVWNDATILPTLLVSQEGVYDVTLTNANGCSYSPPARNVEVNPAPIGVIKFLEVNELGQVVGVQFPQAAVCAGDDVTLQIQDNGNYTFQWSGGNGNDGILVFSEDRGNLLSVGTHTFTVTVTNPATGCTTVLAPFTVTVNPVPENFSLSANNVCAGTPSTISYTGPQPPEWQIFWNTGDGGPTLQTEEAGLYFVRVVNEFGCTAQSNTVVIFPGPNISALPSGCHERCNPDTLCLPSLPEIVSWQWFFEGTAIPGATSSQFAATESGTYWAELVDVNGCEATSAPLTVELYDGFGNVLGQVWSDVNDNGLIDAADTLVAGIPVQLWQNGTLVAPDQSGPNGSFDWLNVLSANYTVQIDSQSLSPLWDIVILADSVSLTGCGGKVYAQLLVDAYTCPPIESSLALWACPGSSATYQSTDILAGQTQAFTFANLLGCDSVVTVTVNPFPTSVFSIETSICPGSVFPYNGTNLLAGQSQNFVFQNWLGCDSVVTVNVLPLPVSYADLNISICPGTTYEYNGVNIGIGESPVFILDNWLGCDSILTVNVSALPALASTLNASVCPGGVFSFQGVDLAVGQTQDFTLQNSAGCDSIVTVTVSALPASASTLSASVCPGGVFSFQGVDLAPGQIQDFTLQNAQGCDSIVTVTVSILPTSSSAFSVGVCPNETYTYQGVTLSASTAQEFLLTNAFGCDSVVTVSVFEKPSSAEVWEEKVCPGTTYVFGNQEIAIGETRTFQFFNSEGCDSTITISVTAWPTLEMVVATQISCPNKPTGSLSVTVLAGGSAPVAYSLDNSLFQTSPLFDNISAGTQTIFVRDEQGCVFEETIEVPASPGLEIELPNALVIPCDSVTISVVPGISGDTTGLQLLWWNGAHSPSVTVSEAGPLWLEATNHCETLRREGQVNWADSEGDTLLVYLPNVFEPAAELTENTIFRPFFGKNLSLISYRLEVYDRWGNFLYETETLENGWPGKVGPTQTGTDVFVWQMWARVAFCGREIELYKKGDVTVVR